MNSGSTTTRARPGAPDPPEGNPAHTTEPAASSDATPTKPKSPLIRRVLAFTIDLIILGVFGQLLSLIFYSTFIGLGQAGPLLGLIIALLYFGLMNSGIMGGQTLGKRVLKLRVSRLDDSPLPLHVSCIRSLVYVFPLLINGRLFDFGEGLGMALIYGLMTGAMLASLLALVLFTAGNWRAGRLLQDVLFGTQVRVDAGEPARTTTRRELILAALTCLVFVGFGGQAIVGYTNQTTDRRPSDERAMATALEADHPGWQYGLSLHTTQINGRLAILRVSIIPDRALTEPEQKDARKRVARRILTEYAGIGDLDLMSVAVIEGFDIGIASRRHPPGERWSVGEWRKKLSVAGDVEQGNGKEVPRIPGLWKH